MIRMTMAVGCVLGLVGAASAQPPGYGMPGSGYNPNVMPNIYNPRTQPLSPYLNLFRGAIPSVNYYYGVRPGTVGGAGSIGGAAGLAQGGSRPATFPIQFGDPEAVQLAEPGQGYIVPPAGHPVVFNNTLGYFPGGAGARGGLRPGIGGSSPRR